VAACDLSEVECVLRHLELVHRAPVTPPAVIQIKVAIREGLPITDLQKRIDVIAGDRVAHIPELVSDFVADSISGF
jgi:S-adenosylmethionine synthetase